MILWRRESSKWKFSVIAPFINWLPGHCQFFWTHTENVDFSVSLFLKVMESWIPKRTPRSCHQLLTCTPSSPAQECQFSLRQIINDHMTLTHDTTTKVLPAAARDPDHCNEVFQPALHWGRKVPSSHLAQASLDIMKIWEQWNKLWASSTDCVLVETHYSKDCQLLEGRSCSLLTKDPLTSQRSAWHLCILNEWKT